MIGLPADYIESEDYRVRVYAGVLGKILGVYFGRPVEGWTFETIMATHGVVRDFVPADGDLPVVVSDDDVSVTFTLPRAIEDSGLGTATGSGEFAQTWLDYAVENRTMFWWGGFGRSTEHTAHRRLLDGVMPPASGASSVNGHLLSEQVGGEIFIDALAMLMPGDPHGAADLVERAARVSHDGSAVDGARLIAAMESAAFAGLSVQDLLDVGLTVVPSDSTVAEIVDRIRTVREAEPDWQKARILIEESFGGPQHGGSCHVIPNLALVLLALVYGDGDVAESFSILATCGRDTDSNLGNLGALVGIRGSLAGIDAAGTLRDRVRDRMIVVSSDGTRAITDAVAEADRLVGLARRMARSAIAPRAADGQPLVPVSTPHLERLIFDLPGALRGAAADGAELRHVSLDGSGAVEAIPTREQWDLTFPTYLDPDQLDLPFYEAFASPRIYAGDVVGAVVDAGSDGHVQLLVRAHGAGW